MPDITSRMSGRTKKLDVSQFFGESAYITLIQLKRTERKRIQLLSMSTAVASISRKMAESGGPDNFDPISVGRMFLELPEDERNKAAEVSGEIEKIIIESGVHQTNHNLLDNEGKPYPLNIDFWENFPEACQFVIEQSKKFNEDGLPLGEPQ